MKAVYALRCLPGVFVRLSRVCCSPPSRSRSLSLACSRTREHAGALRTRRRTGFLVCCESSQMRTRAAPLNPLLSLTLACLLARRLGWGCGTDPLSRSLAQRLALSFFLFWPGLGWGVASRSLLLALGQRSARTPPAPAGAPVSRSLCESLR